MPFIISSGGKLMHQVLFMNFILPIINKMLLFKHHMRQMTPKDITEIPSPFAAEADHVHFIIDQNDIEKKLLGLR